MEARKTQKSTESVAAVLTSSLGFEDESEEGDDLAVVFPEKMQKTIEGLFVESLVGQVSEKDSYSGIGGVFATSDGEFGDDHFSELSLSDNSPNATLAVIKSKHDEKKARLRARVM